MRKKQEQTPTTADLATQPFFYEIRVKGRLSDEQWTAWFSNLTVSTNKGESMLRGTLPDHAALYGLLARLRDLAVPLLSVKVLDAEAQRKMRLQSRRYDLLFTGLLLVIYLTLVGGLAAITTFLASGGILDTALALAVLFAAQGALAYVFSLWSGQRVWRKAWRWLTFGSWLASVITFLIFTAVANVLPSALAIALLLLLGAGGLIYLLSFLRGRAERVNNVIVEWESLSGRARTTEAEHKDESIGQDTPQ
jgi:VIT1/CCC1 family predicted Fe2+/Mn2+ transporter